MNRAALRGCIAMAVAAAFLVNGSAAMASTGKIAQLLPEGSKVDIVFQASGLPEGVDIDPESVRVTVGGQVLPSDAKPVASSEKPAQRTAVLAFDNSRSMAGSKIEAARSAAMSFLENLPPDVSVGLVTFNSGTQVVSPPTPDRAALTTLINELTIADTIGTALYKGAVAALEQAGTEGIRSVLILTDGKPGRADTTREEALAAVAQDDVHVDAVYIGPDQTPPAQLDELVSGASGAVLKSDPSGLTSVFTSAARTISSQLQIRVTVPAALAGKSSTLVVNATAGNELLTDSAFATLAKAPAGPVDPGRFGPRAVRPSSIATLVSDPLLPVALGILFVGMLALVSVGFVAAGVGQTPSTPLRRRLSIYTLTGRQATLKQQNTRLGGSTVARSAVELAGRVVQQRGFESAVGERLEAAGVPLRAAEWMLIHIGVGLLFPLMLALLSGGAILPTLVGLVLGLALPWLYLGYKQSRRTSAFLAQLPDTLQLVAGSLSAGYSLPQALDTVVREGQQPITGEFNRALVEARLGVPTEVALEGVAKRMGSKDFEWVVMAVRIQREVGGNLAEVLTTVAATLRERERLRRQVSVLSAEGRLSAWILGALPPVFALYLLLTKPDYLRPLVTQPLGWVLIATGITLLTVGVLWMRQAVKVEV